VEFGFREPAFSEARGGVRQMDATLQVLEPTPTKLPALALEAVCDFVAESLAPATPGATGSRSRRSAAGATRVSLPCRPRDYVIARSCSSASPQRCGEASSWRSRWRTADLPHRRSARPGRREHKRPGRGGRSDALRRARRARSQRPRGAELALIRVLSGSTGCTRVQDLISLAIIYQMS